MKKRIIFLSLILIILVVGCVPEERILDMEGEVSEEPVEGIIEEPIEEVPETEKITRTVMTSYYQPINRFDFSKGEIVEKGGDFFFKVQFDLDKSGRKIPILSTLEIRAHCGLKDMGVVSLDEVIKVPTDFGEEDTITPIVGHAYVIRTLSEYPERCTNLYGKIKIKSVEPGLKWEWAYPLK